MDHQSSKPPKHHSSKGGASGSTDKQSTDRQNVNPSQSGTPVAKKSSHTSAGPGGAITTEDKLNPEIIAMEQQMERMFVSRSPPARPAGTHPKPKPSGTPKPKPHSSSTQPQTVRRSEVQTQQPAAPSAQAPPVPVATGDRHQQPRAQTHQVPYAQTSQPAPVQIPQATGGTSSHDQQRSTEKRTMPAVMGNQRTTSRR